ncbi:hypothetical protein AVEN_249838-1 [Araneus ventricosus]|uniref:Uncharacterized protein n=1 Tax=Araneus ventricosus TaxID=182803 RepID=A0A4Y2R3C3_ARAVE|nr:hypothetical protein AVEN_249838-1 [Araneus ventricosus]
MTRSTPEMCVAPPLSKLPHRTRGMTFGPYVRFIVQQAQCTTDLQWNLVLIQEPSRPEDETFPLVHRGLPLNGYARRCKKYNLELNVSKTKKRNWYSIATRPTKLQKF